MIAGSTRPEILLGGRYVLADVLASGGMATVHIGRLLGEGGFSRTVAIKRLHPQFVHDAEFVAMFLDEARLVARIRHPNVVPTLDVVSLENEIFLVMELVIGESLARLLRVAKKRKTPVPLNIASGMMMGALQGLHAAHEAKDEQGAPLNIVHRDVTPHNILIGTDGIPRIIDFGVAKAIGQMHLTREGQIKGKVAYMSPEQLRAKPLDRRADVYAAGVVLWETLTGRKLFQAEDDVSSVVMALDGVKVTPSSINPALPKELDEVVMRALAPDPAQRYATAREMALDLERVAPCASAYTIGAWVEDLAQDEMEKRSAQITQLENSSSVKTSEVSEKIRHLSQFPPALGPTEPPAEPTSAVSRGGAQVSEITGGDSQVSEIIQGDSQVSELSLTSDPRGAGVSGRARLVPVVAAAIFLGGFGFWWLTRTPEVGPSESVPAATSGGGPASAASPSTPTPPASAAPASSAPAPSASAPAPAVSADPASSAASKEDEEAKAKAKKARKAAATDCSNPYSKGPDGILRIKPGCL